LLRYQAEFGNTCRTRMIRFASTTLVGSLLMVTSVFAQQTAPSSATPSPFPSGQGDERSSTHLINPRSGSW
jgi:hypothetical protein